MNQCQINRAVAQMTGEPLREVRRRGFHLAAPLDVGFDPEPTLRPQTVDWDSLEANRPAFFPVRG